MMSAVIRLPESPVLRPSTMRAATWSVQRRRPTLPMQRTARAQPSLESSQPAVTPWTMAPKCSPTRRAGAGISERDGRVQARPGSAAGRPSTPSAEELPLVNFHDPGYHRIWPHLGIGRGRFGPESGGRCGRKCLKTGDHAPALAIEP